MAKQQPLGVTRNLRVLGEHVSAWRKLQRLTTTSVAARAGVSRNVLRAIEQGTGTTSTENLFRVLRVLGIADGIVSAADPYKSDVGKMRVDEVLPQRVRG